MGIEIASFIDGEGNITPLTMNGTLIVYRKSEDVWSIDRTREFSMGTSKSMSELREKMTEFTDVLENCKLFIGSSVTGIPFFELEKKGVSVWEFEGKPTDFLGYVFDKEQLDKDESTLLEIEKIQQLKDVTPKDLGNGHYEADITKVQGSNLGITSKQVVLPILKKGSFYQLDVICSHVPKWLDGEIAVYNLTKSLESIGENKLKVIITKKVCL